MTRDAGFERFARDCSQGAILALRRMGGATFTESDRRAMVDGLDVIRVAMVQPVMVVMGAMQLWASGKLDLVEVDPS